MPLEASTGQSSSRRLRIPPTGFCIHGQLGGGDSELRDDVSCADYYAATILL